MPAHKPPITTSTDAIQADSLVLHRYVAGEASAKEVLAVEQWIKADAAHATVVETLQQVSARATVALETRFDTQAALRAFDQRLAVSAGTPLDLLGAPRFPRRSAFVGATALLAMLVLVSFAYVHTYHSPGTVFNAGRIYTTAAGQRETVTLVDGTRFTLAPASRLRLANDYGRGTRHVMLEGEAYFSVRHDANHPFAVEARGTVVRDVGTTFDVRAYAEDSGARVAVMEGIVAIDNATATAGDVLTAVDGHVVLQRDAPLASLTAWMQGDLVFDKTPLREVVRDISRAYGVSITVADSTLLSRRVTTTLSGKPLDAALTVVTSVLGARFERTAQGIVIHNGTGSTRLPNDPHPVPLVTARAEYLQQ